MPVTLQRQECRWLIQLDGPINLASAGELKKLLLEWLASGKDLVLDLEHAEEIDLICLQLVSAAAREARRTGVAIAARASQVADRAARESGLPDVPGFPCFGALNE